MTDANRHIHDVLANKNESTIKIMEQDIHMYNRDDACY